MIKPDGRIDINGKTISALEEFQRAILQVTGDGSATDPRKLKTRDAIIQVYGGISTTNEWVNASKYLSLYTIDSSIINNPSYNCINVYHPNKSKLDKFWCHKAMHPFLSKAFENLKTNNLLSELKEFGGYHNVRATRGTNYWSAHSWALAIDINITENPLNAEPKLSKKFVECFKNAGFGWGGDYKRKDGMHFTIAGFDIPKT
ncbi:MAG: M15 family metallopeptidase [Gammaproteobacteria bacterium]|nr:M15 family metallopeptidase [Gammaproteobacteria bacterium]